MDKLPCLETKAREARFLIRCLRQTTERLAEIVAKKAGSIPDLAGTIIGRCFASLLRRATEIGERSTQPKPPDQVDLLDAMRQNLDAQDAEMRSLLVDVAKVLAFAVVCALGSELGIVEVSWLTQAKTIHRFTRWFPHRMARLHDIQP